MRFARQAGAEGATAPETLRPTDRSGMTLWKAACHCDGTSFFLPSPPHKAYPSLITKLLDRAIEAARAMPPEMQDELARTLPQFAGEDQPVIPLTPKERSSLEESLAQADRGEFATDEQVRAVWAKHGL